MWKGPPKKKLIKAFGALDLGINLNMYEHGQHMSYIYIYIGFETLHIPYMCW
jgi:hypothetical protein